MRLSLEPSSLAYILSKEKSNSMTAFLSGHLSIEHNSRLLIGTLRDKFNATVPAGILPAVDLR